MTDEGAGRGASEACGAHGPNADKPLWDGTPKTQALWPRTLVYVIFNLNKKQTKKENMLILASIK